MKRLHQDFMEAEYQKPPMIGRVILLGLCMAVVIAGLEMDVPGAVMAGSGLFGFLLDRR